MRNILIFFIIIDENSCAAYWNRDTLLHDSLMIRKFKNSIYLKYKSFW